MHNNFDCLSIYVHQDKAEKREKAVQAAMILINTAVNPDNPFKTLNSVNDGLVKRIADSIQEAYLDDK
jgi:hypothetical protein